MKWYKAEVLVGFKDEYVKTWSEGADLTFALAHYLHRPHEEVYLFDHCIHPTPAKEAEKLKFSIITPEGGV